MAMAELKGSVPWRTFDTVEAMRKFRDVPRSQVVREVSAMGLSYLEYASRRIEEFLGYYKQGSITPGSIALNLVGEIHEIMDHIEVVVDYMVKNGKLIRDENGRVHKLPTVSDPPKTKHGIKVTMP